MTAYKPYVRLKEITVAPRIPLSTRQRNLIAEGKNPCLSYEQMTKTRFEWWALVMENGSLVDHGPFISEAAAAKFAGTEPRPWLD